MFGDGKTHSAGSIATSEFALWERRAPTVCGEQRSFE